MLIAPHFLVRIVIPEPRLVCCFFVLHLHLGQCSFHLLDTVPILKQSNYMLQGITQQKNLYASRKTGNKQVTEIKRKRKPTFFIVSGSTEGTKALVIGKSLILDKKKSSQGASNNIPCPTLPLRPVLPSRCIYCCLSAGTPTYVCNKGERVNNKGTIGSNLQQLKLQKNVLKLFMMLKQGKATLVKKNLKAMELGKLKATI